MRVLDHLPTEVVRVEDAEGKTVRERLTAHVQSELVIVDDATVPFEEGHVVVRSLPNGRTERFKVVEATFWPDTGPLRAHYQLKVQKTTRLPVPNESRGAVIYNVSGPHARINVNSDDNSINISNVTPDQLFNRMIEATATVADAKAREALLVRIQELQNCVARPSFAAAYRDFMAIAADHIAVYQPFLVALAQMLG